MPAPGRPGTAPEAHFDPFEKSLKLAEPLVVTMARRQFQNDLDNLRDFMEAHAL